MPFRVIASDVCPECPYGRCVADLRDAPVGRRTTRFRFGQTAALNCSFDSFVPGTDSDPEPDRTFAEYRAQVVANVMAAGQHFFADAFDVQHSALAKVGGDIVELLEAAALWNATAVWNQYMDTGQWVSGTFTMPENAVATPRRRVAFVKLPRGYDTTRLFKESVRADIKAHERALQERGMELGLSSPDIVGVRIPDPMPPSFQPFLRPLHDVGAESLDLLQEAYRFIEGTLDGTSLLLAIAVKTTTRSDRLYQPLFESNVLKYLIGRVLRGSTFRFHAHMGSFEGANVRRHYQAASLVSLMQGGEPALAVDRLCLAERPREIAQVVLDELVRFPL